MLSHCRAEVGDENRQHVVTFAEPRAPRRMGEEQVNTVAIFRRDSVEIDAHQVSEAVVPRHDIKVRFLNAGGFRHQGIQQATRAFADPLTAHRLRASPGGKPASTKRCRASVGVHCSAFAMAAITALDGLTSRPCSSQVYQVTPTSASIATSSRRRPGVRRRPLRGKPRRCGSRLSRRARKTRPAACGCHPRER